MQLLILKVGSTVDNLLVTRGDFADWFRDGLGYAADEITVLDPPAGDPLPDPERAPPTVVTGSPAMVTDEAPWSLACERWIERFVDRADRTPLLGVCYGHQLLARALGGTVGDQPNGREIGTCRVELTEDGQASELFAGLPSELMVQSSHQQSVLALPAGARHLAHNAHDAHQAFCFGSNAFGVQFHPEFDAGISRGYLTARADALRAEGLDPDRLLGEVAESEHGPKLLQNFRRICDDR